MIQDIQPHHYDNQYRQIPPDSGSAALYYGDHSVLLKRTAAGIEFPRFRDLERLNEEIYEESIYLFSIDEERYYLVQEISREPLSEFTMENTEIFRTAEPRYRSFAGITGYQLHNWYRNHKYCGRSGVYEWIALGVGNRTKSVMDLSEPEVVDIEENEDGTVTLTVNAVSEGMMDDAVLTHRLTVRFTDGGGIEFLKNEVEGDALERMPDYVYRIQES